MEKEESPPTSRRKPKTGETARPESEDVRRAIAEGFGEYRRQIGDIRARHGRRAKRSILN